MRVGATPMQVPDETAVVPQATSPRGEAPPDSASWPAARVAWSTVVMLAMIQGFNAVDRHLINLLVEPIKSDLGITDAQVGLLLGLSFAMFYASFGVPLGRLADTYSRRLIIFAGTLFWSISTCACGLAQSFAQLFSARVAVGAGEASLNPSGYSMIADLFPPERRAKPMGVFIAGHTIGQAVTLFGGGLLVQHLVTHHVTWSLPGGMLLKDWQIAFVVAGVPGLAIALLALAMREPDRRETLAGAGDAAGVSSVPVRQVARFVAHRARLYLPMISGFSLVLLWHMGNVVWAPTFLMRSFGFSPAQVGAILGAMTLVFNSSGVVLAGSLSEYLARKGHRDCHIRGALIAAVCALPFALCATLMPSPLLALAMLGPAFFFGSVPFTLAPAAIAGVTPNQMRAQVTAVYLLFVNAVGSGVGPWLVGRLTDVVFRDPLLLKYSIATTALFALPIAIALLWRAKGEYQRAVDGLEPGLFAAHAR